MAESTLSGEWRSCQAWARRLVAALVLATPACLMPVFATETAAIEAAVTAEAGVSSPPAMAPAATVPAALTPVSPVVAPAPVLPAAPPAVAPAPAAPAASVMVLGEAEAAVQQIPHLTYFVDTEASLKVEQIEGSALQFAPFDPQQPLLLDKGTLWLRFDAMVTSGSKPHWWLTVPLPALDEARLYYRQAVPGMPGAADDRWVVQQAGDTLPMNQWVQRSRYPVFALDEQPGQPVRYYLQIRHAQMPYSTMPRIVSDAVFIQSRQNEHMLLGIYFGLAALMVMLAGVNAIAYRDQGFATYAFYMALFAGGQACVSGIAALYLWPESPGLNNSATMLMMASTGAAALWFVRTVTSPRRYSHLLDRLMLGLMVLMPFVALISALLQTQFSFTVYNTLLIITVVLLLISACIPLSLRERHSGWVAAGFVPVLLGAMLPLLRNAGFLPASFMTDYGLMLGSALQAPILFYGLHRRVAQRRNLTARATTLHNNDPLTGVSSARVLITKLRQSLATHERYKLPFALLLVELTNLATLQKHHGREVGDRALVMAAARIRGVAHAADNVARIGDNQFALLIEGPIEADAANQLATKILASGLRPSIELPDAEPLLFHVAIGHIGKAANANAGQTEAAFERMVQILKDMHDGSRKAIRLLNF